MILKEISEYAKKRVQEDKLSISLEDMKKEAYALKKGDFRFENVLRDKNISIICEVKKASPSKGIISENFLYKDIAIEYEAVGADCISVLTEPKWFLGSDAIFKEIRKEVKLPMLRKDFTVDEYQIYQAKVMGADAILLICKLLDTERLKKYIKISDDLGLSVLVETHNEEEIASAIEAKARIIGVNNRNLQNFSVDLANSVNLRQHIPENLIFVAESGVATPQDGIILGKSGANSILIGEALMRSSNKREFLNEIRNGLS